MGIDLDGIAPDIARRAWPEAAQDVASALAKLEKQLYSGAWRDLAYVPGALLQVVPLAIQLWPMACGGLAAMAGLLFLGMRAPKQSRCSWQEAVSRSFQKCKRIFFGILLPVCLMYSDMMTDLLVLQKFWSSKQLQYFALNLFAVITGLVTSAIIGPGGVRIDMQSEVLQGMQGHLHVLSGLQLTPLFCMILGLREFWSSDFDSGRSFSFENRLRDTGITAEFHHHWRNVWRSPAERLCATLCSTPTRTASVAISLGILSHLALNSLNCFLCRERSDLTNIAINKQEVLNFKVSYSKLPEKGIIRSSGLTGPSN